MWSCVEGDALSLLVFNFVLEYAVRTVKVNQDSLKLNGKHQLLGYADDVIIYWAYYKEKTKILVIAVRKLD